MSSNFRPSALERTPKSVLMGVQQEVKGLQMVPNALRLNQAGELTPKDMSWRYFTSISARFLRLSDSLPLENLKHASN